MANLAKKVSIKELEEATKVTPGYVYHPVLKAIKDSASELQDYWNEELDIIDDYFAHEREDYPFYVYDFYQDSSSYDVFSNSVVDYLHVALRRDFTWSLYAICRAFDTAVEKRHVMPTLKKKQ